MSMLDQSILTSVKQSIGMSDELKIFDADVIRECNTAFMILNQLGVGPTDCFIINDNTTKWSAFMQDNTKIIGAITYVCLKASLYFDPPTSAAIKEAKQQSINELEWRLTNACISI